MLTIEGKPIGLRDQAYSGRSRDSPRVLHSTCSILYLARINVEKVLRTATERNSLCQSPYCVR